MHLDDQDRVVVDASLVLCRAVEAAMAAAQCSVLRACEELAERLVSGAGRPELLAAAQAAYVKPRKAVSSAPAAAESTGDAPGVALGGVAALARRLYRMMAFFERGRKAGDVAQFLAPGKRLKEGHNPAHIAAFLRFYCRPTRPPVAEAYRAMLPYLAERGLPAPSLSTVNRIEQSLPVTVKYRGRVTGSEWRSLLPYIERDVSMFKANDLWVGDGHSFKAKVAHPVHGQPYVPEITLVIDWVSRKIVGWSVALSESTVAVSDAFRHAQLQTRARPLVYYSDNGSGQTGKRIDHPIAGTLARQGIAHETGIPGNPQGRGVIERLWQVTLIALARTYPTCLWRGADEHHTQKMLKALNKPGFGGVALPSFEQLLTDIEACVTHYNARHEHSELGATPDEMYLRTFDAEAIAFGPSDEEIAALWRPEVIRTPQRGRVSLFGNTYCKDDLVKLLPEGTKVRVRYDLHHAERIQLYTLEGVHLGEADWTSHKEAAFPVAEMDRLREERAQRRIAALEKKVAEAQAELSETYDLTPAIPAPLPQAAGMPAGVDPHRDAPEDRLQSWEDTVRQLYHLPSYGEDEESEDGEHSEAAAR
ncbi:Mu transposase C-terminal domain-containing protein [Accumulibacter sp.]|nr:Mu transposase C-terminal domain-containing protein [Accumulibacter sp.]MDS4056467.1 Mu transposase C-terminal domain-containing protein [Accumulibacter sp.]